MQLTVTERIRLLIHIVRELRVSHGITVDILKMADQPIRDQIRPNSRLRFLEEIYDIREAEEHMLSRQTSNAIANVIVILDANIFHPDRQMVQQASNPDVFDIANRASRATGPTGCTDNDRDITRSTSAFVSGGPYAPSFNTSLTSFTYCGTAQHVPSRQCENYQDHEQPWFHSGQPAVPFHVQHSQWKPSLSETSSFTGSAVYTSSFPNWYECAIALPQEERYRTSHLISGS